MSFRYPQIPLFWDAERLDEFLRRIAQGINGLFEGHINTAGEFTLDASGSTVVEDPLVNDQTTVLITPVSTNASGVAYHVTAASGQFTVTTAASITNADYRYVLLG